jgi:septum formation protein
MSLDLKTTRVAVEALATALDTMEHDCLLVAQQLRATAKASDLWTDELLKEQDAPTAVAKTVMLASSSVFRRAVVASVLPDAFEMYDEFLSPDIDEKAIRRDRPEDLVLAIANAKADKAVELLSARAAGGKPRPDMIVCADQVVLFGEEVREKPSSAAEAKEHLQSYGRDRKPARCMTGVVVVSGEAFEHRVQGVEVATQHFEPVPEDVADMLVAKGQILKCAGAFMVEEPLLQRYLSNREGDVSAIQGMPAALTRTLLLRARDLLLEGAGAGEKRVRLADLE